MYVVEHIVFAILMCGYENNEIYYHFVWFACNFNNCAIIIQFSITFIVWLLRGEVFCLP